MSSDFDPADFVDNDFQARKAAAASSTTSASSLRAPSREEVDSKVLETQQRLAELKRAQEELERERASLEETRRRRMEFQTGRQEMLENLTRGVGLLEEAEFVARRDAEQMAKTLADFRDALAKVEATNEETWTKDNFNVELTRALTAIENARMEWNTARLKFPVLSGQASAKEAAAAQSAGAASPLIGERNFLQLCKMGLAFTWPVAAVILIGFGMLIFVMASRR
ncbi:MAG TPA: hypothetical protein VK327_04395 [Candidatus Paceibacterota bacterium]|nr:hypothetical protein [Candidatus Paceibacterota bacterium]